VCLTKLAAAMSTNSFSAVFSSVTTVGSEWGMTAARRVSLDQLLFVVSLGAVAAATATAFFGAAYFLSLASPNSAKVPTDLSPPTQALNTDEFPTPGGNEPTGSTESTGHNVTTSPRASPLSNVTIITGAPSDQEGTTVSSRVTQATPRLIRPAGIPHAKRVRIVRYHSQVSKRYDAFWRPDARAGPNPGGGFYGPPNINVGYINPR